MKWFRQWQDTRRQWYYEHGYGSACVQVLIYLHPIDFVREEVVRDKANSAFDDGWLAACHDLEDLLPAFDPESVS